MYTHVWIEIRLKTTCQFKLEFRRYGRYSMKLFKNFKQGTDMGIFAGVPKNRINTN